VSDVGQAVTEFIHSRYSSAPISPVTTDRGRVARMKRIERETGSPKAAAAAVGVSRETWRRWGLTGRNPRTGKPYQKPKAANLANLDRLTADLYRRTLLRGLQRTLAAVTQIRITGVIRWNGYLNKLGGGYRTTTLPGPADLRPVILPYAEGGFSQVGDQFEHAIGLAEGASIHLEGNAVEVSWK